MLTITEAARRADPRPPIGTVLLIREGGRERSACVKRYPRGDGRSCFPVQDVQPPCQWQQLTIGDPRIVEPTEFGPKPRKR
jgi:hypothetical protein